MCTSPFVAFLVLLICSLIPTAFIYMVISKAVETNLATLKGTIQGFAVELGGPVAFYIILLLLGKSYISPYAEITLKGIVTDSDGNLQKGYAIATLYKTPLPPDPEGHFQIKARHEDSGMYHFFVTRNGMPWTTDKSVPNLEDITIAPLPDANMTKVIGDVGKTIYINDHIGQPVSGSFTLSLEPSIDPKQVLLREGKKVEISIENSQYIAIIRDANNRVRAREPLPPITHGVPFQIMKTFILVD